MKSVLVAITAMVLLVSGESWAVNPCLSVVNQRIESINRNAPTGGAAGALDRIAIDASHYFEFVEIVGKGNACRIYQVQQDNCQITEAPQLRGCHAACGHDRQLARGRINRGPSRTVIAPGHCP